jgi:hypothetical protein
MKIITYASLDTILEESSKANIKLDENDISFSFSIFENRKRTYLHIFYK